MEFIDTHAHLFFESFSDDLDQVIARASAEGVTSIVIPGTTLETSRTAVELAGRFPGVYAAVGIHPHDASGIGPEQLAVIEEMSNEPRVVAIGEIGLDYHYDFATPADQKKVFTAQVMIAQRRNLPVIIHCREAETDLLRLIADLVAGSPSWRPPAADAGLRRGVFHCFAGDIAMARTVNNLGFYISFPGPLTYASKPSRPNTMAEVAAAIPLGNILLETDSPFLTPVPFRGKRNEPANTPLIGRRLAELTGKTLEEVGRVTTLNARGLFGIVDSGDNHWAAS